MTEIRTAADLHHPAGRAWRALTDRRLLPKWFAETDLEPRIGARFQIEPVDLAGLPGPIDGEVVELDEPHRIVMRWTEQDRQTLVICDLRPSPTGCQLVLREYCEEGEWTLDLRDLRLQTYEQLLTGRLPAVLDWLAFREVDFSDESADDADVPEDDASARTRTRRRRVIVAVVAAVGLLGVGTAVAFAAQGGADKQPQTPDLAAPSGASSSTALGVAATRQPDGTAAPSRTSTRATGTPSASPTASATVRPTPPTSSAANAPKPGTAALAGKYNTVSSDLGNYSGEIVINNTGDGPATGWTATITLAGGSEVHNVSGAKSTQKDKTVTFTGSAIPAGGSIRVGFDVRNAPLLGAKRPGSCTVDGQPCAGL